MNCKIIFIDIDGTLVDSNKKITPEVKSALTTAMEKGIKVAIASGRPLHGVLPYVDELELVKYGGYVLSFNGGRIVDCSNNEVIYDVSLSYDTIVKAYNLSKEYNIDLITYKGDNILSENPDNKYTEIESRINNMPVIPVDNVLEELKNMPVKCLVVGDGDILEKAEPVFKEKLNGEAKVFRSEPFFLEVMPNGIDKAASIKEFIKKLGIKQEETMAFGDGFNDVSMIEYCGVGVAMKNGCDDILKKADYITEYSNDENGIAEFLKKYNII